ncbi:hypothetical protein NLX86_07160 [Streptomyces sp. A3M-1-3]|uniref:hypothetical protein n=1 Tax=Streptomyces sp. A3M-1-3 TaxID=2962044 RepID=UPI0020B7685D|nr:hypothetical protein [Streptomyces sp. A3M-1-3]MCP3817919.1 hypothetical protein [Streptomyces sp. A3M-1-3]
MSASTAGGALNVVRGGAAREFTVTVRNGNIRVYGQVLVVFQMEIMVEGVSDGPAPPQNGFVLERRDPATGAWRTVELRVANDVQPHWLFTGGTPLARDAARTERYRIRAGATGPVGFTPLMIRLIDTGAPQNASYEQGGPARSSLPVSARHG